MMELIPPDCWNNVNGWENPADCASQGLFPSELLNLALWWDRPRWLPDEWPKQSTKWPLTGKWWSVPTRCCCSLPASHITWSFLQFHLTDLSYGLVDVFCSQLSCSWEESQSNCLFIIVLDLPLSKNALHKGSRSSRSKGSNYTIEFSQLIYGQRSITTSWWSRK